MIRRATPLLVLCACWLLGCTELRPVDPSPGESWVAAKREAYRGPAKLHKVVRGDTASGIAERYGVTLQALAAVNSLRKPYVVQVGSDLAIPQPDRRSALVAANPVRLPLLPAAPTLAVSPMAPKPHSSEVRVATLAALPAPAAEEVSAAAPVVPVRIAPIAPGDIARASAKRLPGLTGDGFLWPTSGSVVSQFGHKRDGSANDGINIAAARGTPVLAAENGVVSYASDGIAGWGRMVLVRHADGFTTGYAHLETILTRVGDNVARGQVIGRVGQTGNVDSPQLHFELRSGKRALNPSTHLVKHGEMAVASR